MERSVLILCDGNTCRSPTLTLLLLHSARARGVADRITFTSGGLSNSEDHPRPMLGVAQRALLRAAASLVDDQGLLGELEKEARSHGSRRIDLAEIERSSYVVCLIPRKNLRRRHDARVALDAPHVEWIGVRDAAYAAYMDCGEQEDHRDVVAAYEQQADLLADIVRTRLNHLLVVE